MTTQIATSYAIPTITDLGSITTKTLGSVHLGAGTHEVGAETTAGSKDNSTNTTQS
jgi:hypothetical protein